MRALTNINKWSIREYTFGNFALALALALAEAVYVVWCVSTTADIPITEPQTDNVAN